MSSNDNFERRINQIYEHVNSLDNWKNHLMDKAKEAARSDSELEKLRAEASMLRTRVASLEGLAGERAQFDKEKKLFTTERADLEKLHYQKGYMAAVTDFFNKASGTDVRS
jgi:septal ring factor EnvC (AmiA/AmiB activator)